MTKNILTVDWEDWYQGNQYIKLNQAGQFEERIEGETEELLKLLGRFRVKATFFLLGHLVEKYPGLVRAIDKAGHELASHGYSHEMLDNLTKKEFAIEVRRTNEAIKKVSGKKVRGFRASNWSVNKKTWWALEVLKKEGFVYDSSIFPFRSPYYGMNDSPRFPYKHKNGLWEIPPSTVRLLGQNIPVGGGVYLRVAPGWVASWAMRELNSQGRALVAYVHPWELDTDQPRPLPIPAWVNLAHYFNLASTKFKLEKLLKEFEWVTMGEFVGELRHV